MPLFVTAGFCYGLGTALSLPLIMSGFRIDLSVTLLGAFVLLALMIGGSLRESAPEADLKSFSHGLFLSVLPIIGSFSAYGYLITRAGSGELDVILDSGLWYSSAVVLGLIWVMSRLLVRLGIALTIPRRPRAPCGPDPLLPPTR